MHLRGFPEWRGVGALALCRVPVLILRSRTGGSNESARLPPIRADLQFGLTVGAGHFNQLEVPEQVNPTIELFLEIALPTRTRDGVRM
jgi:pimeloyl-ACP methyl ester carboxylesterase